MTERTKTIKRLISGQVDMGTFGLVELELLAIENEMEALRQPPFSGSVCEHLHQKWEGEYPYNCKKVC